MATPPILLLLSILSSTGIFLIFRLIERRGIKSFPVIVINYIIASGLGYLLSRKGSQGTGSLPIPFYGLAIVIGILFIVMFFVVGMSSRKAGMSITTVAGKMSVIFPIAFSLLFDPADVLTVLKMAGILIAVPGVIMTVMKKKEGLQDPALIYFPLILFVGMGLVDSLVKLAQYTYISEDNLSLFTALLFSISAIIGVAVSFFRKQTLLSLFRPAVLFWGFCLGMVNFGSIYFLVRTLDYQASAGTGPDSSVVFGINNTGILTLSVFLGLILFREKLTLMNVAGIMTCILATVLLAYAG